jgi:two-component system, cell cycle sensor histidine kinase and response regulator CckA
MPQTSTDLHSDLETLYHFLPQGIAIHEIIYNAAGTPCDYCILDVNAAYEKILDIPRKQAVGESARKLYGTGEAPFLETYARVAEYGISECFEIYWLPMDKHFSITVVSLNDEKFATVFSDISKIKMTADARKQSEVRLRTCIEHSPDHYILLSPEYNILFVNHALNGITPEDMIGTSLSDHIPASSRPAIETCLKKVTQNGTPQACTVTCEGNNGSSSTVSELRVHPMYLNDGSCDLLVVMTDISDRISREEQLRQDDTLKAVGRLAGGVAHEINNQLTGIVGNAELLLDEIKDNPLLAGYVNDILCASGRTTDLTSRLLAFSRQGKYRNNNVHMHEIISDIADCMEQGAGGNIVIIKKLEAAADGIVGDPGQLHSAIADITRNARDAIERNRGEIVFSTEVTTLDKEYCDNNPNEINPGNYFRLSISDSGKGMSDTVKSHMFEPFFTTKENGQGTGMGLSSVFGIIKTHKGMISVASKVGQGTTVTVFIPLAQSVQKKNGGDEKRTVNDTRHILVVDDEKLIRKVAGSLLRKLGYSVTICSDGAEAITLFSKKWKEFDLIILDMIMPGMGGKETFLKMKQIDPKVNVLLSSGYSISGEAEKIMNLGARGFIQKPYRLAELSQTIAQLLSGTES